MVVGSGKTHTMMGEQGSEIEKGLIPRLCQELFDSISEDSQAQYTINISYLEIYNEEIADLLNPGKNENLQLREHPELGFVFFRILDLHLLFLGVYVDGLCELDCQNSNDMMEYLKQVSFLFKHHQFCFLIYQN